MGTVKPEHKRSAINRLKTVRGHLDAVLGMVEEERYCPDVMKQVSALQASLEKVNRILLQNHLRRVWLRRWPRAGPPRSSKS